MSKSRRLSVSSAALTAAGILSACAVDPHAPADASITALVTQALAQHPDLGPPNQIFVDTRGHTVYLSGTVNHSLVVADVQDVVRGVPGVSQVVTNIGVTQGN